MNIKKISLVDYGIGNIASLTYTLKNLGYKVQLSSDKAVLSESDLVILPGVGAFSEAMDALNRSDLVHFLQSYSREGRPLIGICLGMQLLASSSEEFGCAEGLGIIPGEVVRLRSPLWHIGWNSVEAINNRFGLSDFNEKTFYFNHSYYFKGPIEYSNLVCRFTNNIPAVISSGNVVGIQFHPEKSQVSGRQLLNQLVGKLIKDA